MDVKDQLVNLKGRDHMEDKYVDCRIILKWFVKV